MRKADVLEHWKRLDREDIITLYLHDNIDYVSMHKMRYQVECSTGILTERRNGTNKGC